MADTLDFTFSTSGLFAAMLIGIGWLLCRPGPLPRRFLLAALAAYGLAGSWVVAAAAERALAFGLRQAVTDIRPERTVVVLLGAGTTVVEDWSGGRLEGLNLAGMARVREAARLLHLFPDAVAISSGGARRSPRGLTPASELMRHLLVDAGVPPERILVESGSADTRQQAVNVAPMLRRLRPQRVILVTSAAHMRRALGAFRREGFAAEPSAAQSVDLWLGPAARVVPSTRGLAVSASVAHELAGLAYYAANGWLR